MLNTVGQYNGVFFSTKYIRKNLLKQTDEEIANMDKEIEIDTAESESIEHVIQRTKKLTFSDWNTSLGFDEKSHVYAKDETGNSEYISVTTLIERFFPFDLKRYIERKAEEENRTEEDVLDEYLLMRDEAAEKGTFLHNQIENFLKKFEFDSDSKEFELFLRFYNKEIKERNRLGDDRYEEKYGFNDENYIDYFDMLDELAESDSDYDEESDSE